MFQKVAESDENNTFVSAIFRISPRPAQLPDLVIISGNLAVSPLMVASGGKVNLSAWRVKNQGNADSGQFVDGIYLSEDQVITTNDTLRGIDRKPGLAAGDEIGMRSGPTVTIPPGTAPGIYYIGILVDKDHVVTEADETNNTVIAMIYVLA